VGTALKTISMRLRNTAGELQELGEDSEGAAESITKLQTQLLNLTKGRVNIMATNDTFKSTYQIMTELAEVWDTLSDVEQADITRLVAGVKQGNVFNGMLQNMETGIAAANTSLNSQGSALSENAKFLDSIQGKLSILNTTWESFTASTSTADFVKSILDIGTGILGVVNDVGLLGTAITIFSGIILSKFIPTILSATGITNAFTVAVASAPPVLLALGSMAIIGGIIAVVNALNNANESISDMYDTLNKNYQQTNDNIAELEQLASAYEELAKKENKSLQDKTQLADIQTVLNTKYKDAFGGVNLYTDALDLNNTAIEKNIELIRQQAKTEAENFVKLNKLYYDQAKEYTNKQIYREIPNVGGIIFDNPEDALDLGVRDGEIVKVLSRRGEVKSRVKVTETISKGIVSMTFHFSETSTNLITNPALDPVSNTPELKFCAVRVEKI
jgi:formylmethanofuran dehydrogenase subunit D